MPQLVMTSGLRHGVLALVTVCAATLGSARPLDTPERFVRSPEAPTLLVSGGPAPMPRGFVMPFIR
ncbi:hypothetical protein [Stutzerimonas frequens]|uniref:hypothetical protein n=1 Tax=Stutzerimonas frequens TaxID=2968969 RepID=UPI0022DE7DD7|nr:hypothetical protein [Stutzerimonas frequens]MDA0425907.1 hypothetical protein [Stutzerimonas frequens]